MAFSSLFTLLDDITAVLDDVSIMIKMAAKKTAGVIGDDLTLVTNMSLKSLLKSHILSHYNAIHPQLNCDLKFLHCPRIFHK